MDNDKTALLTLGAVEPIPGREDDPNLAFAAWVTKLGQAAMKKWKAERTAVAEYASAGKPDSGRIIKGEPAEVICTAYYLSVICRELGKTAGAHKEFISALKQEAVLSAFEIRSAAGTLAGVFARGNGEVKKELEQDLVKLALEWAR